MRHILRIPQITNAEIEESVARLDSIRTQLIAGTISFGEAVSRYSDDDYAKYTAGRLAGKNGTFLQYAELDKDMVLLLKNANLKPGEYSKPIPFTDERGRKGVRLVALFSRSEPHRENLTDDYDRIAKRALEEKQGLVIQKWFAARIPNYYIMIDDEYKSCNNLGKWRTKEATVSK